jgi:hypothetical protein
MFRLLGPDGIKQRVTELQAKMDRLNPPEKEGVTFHTMLNGEMSGPIGKGGFEPLRPGMGNTTVSPVTAEMKAMINEAATKYGIPENLLDAVVSAESSYNPTAQSRAGAMGLTQLMPGTASALGITNASIRSRTCWAAPVTFAA